MTSHPRNQDPYISWGITLAVVLFVLYVYPGFLIPVVSHFDGSCKTIALDNNAEDLRVDPSNGLVYLTYSKGDIGSRGTVMLIDPNAAEPHVRAALSTEPDGFAPSGLSLYTPPTGPKLLFVTSRTRPGSHFVQIFEQSSTGAFTPRETIRDSLLWSPTAIVAVGPRQFYVVNQLGFKRAYENGGKVTPGDQMRGNLSTVIYYDGEQMKIVADRLSLASGIAMSPDGRTIYVSESARGRIATFERDLSSGALKRTGQIDVPGSPRNLNVDQDGTLWVTNHPHAVPFMDFLQDTDERAPTQILKVTPGAQPDKQVEVLYSNDGAELSAGTAAAPRNTSQFVASSRTDQKLLMCTRSPNAKPAAADSSGKQT
jgi:sugar lactone lactonase YvrE